MAKMYVLVGVVVVLNFGMPRVCCVVVVVVGCVRCEARGDLYGLGEVGVRRSGAKCIAADGRDWDPIALPVPVRGPYWCELQLKKMAWETYIDGEPLDLP